MQVDLKAPFELPAYWGDMHAVAIDYLRETFPLTPFTETDLDLSAFFICCALLDPNSKINKTFLELAEKEWNKDGGKLQDLMKKNGSY